MEFDIYLMFLIAFWCLVWGVVKIGKEVEKIRKILEKKRG